MKKILLSFAVILIALTHSHASADGFNPPTREKIHGSKVNTHIPQDKPDRSCHNWKSNGWIVELEYYLDADGTPIDTAYSDYLEDFAWYFAVYPGTCKVQPETLPEP